jgi:hypothetical protein
MSPLSSKSARLKGDRPPILIPVEAKSKTTAFVRSFEISKRD